MKREVRKVKDEIMRKGVSIFNASRERLKDKKGFTLIEIIVVLVILAVLAAATIPAMLGFVDDARGKAEVANARAAYLACQAIATEQHLRGETSTLTGEHVIGSGTHPKLDSMLSADMSGAKVQPTVEDGKVSQIVYTTIDSAYTITINPPSAAQVSKTN